MEILENCLSPEADLLDEKINKKKQKIIEAADQHIKSAHSQKRIKPIDQRAMINLKKELDVLVFRNNRKQELLKQLQSDLPSKTSYSKKRYHSNTLRNENKDNMNTLKQNINHYTKGLQLQNSETLKLKHKIDVMKKQITHLNENIKSLSQVSIKFDKVNGSTESQRVNSVGNYLKSLNEVVIMNRSYTAKRKERIKSLKDLKIEKKENRNSINKLTASFAKSLVLKEKYKKKNSEVHQSLSGLENQKERIEINSKFYSEKIAEYENNIALLKNTIEGLPSLNRTFSTFDADQVISAWEELSYIQTQLQHKYTDLSIIQNHLTNKLKDTKQSLIDPENMAEFNQKQFKSTVQAFEEKTKIYARMDKVSCGNNEDYILKYCFFCEALLHRMVKMLKVVKFNAGQHPIHVIKSIKSANFDKKDLSKFEEIENFDSYLSSKNHGENLKGLKTFINKKIHNPMMNELIWNNNFMMTFLNEAHFESLHEINNKEIVIHKLLSLSHKESQISVHNKIILLKDIIFNVGLGIKEIQREISHMNKEKNLLHHQSNSFFSFDEINTKQVNNLLKVTFSTSFNQQIKQKKIQRIHDGSTRFKITKMINKKDDSINYMARKKGRNYHSQTALPLLFTDDYIKDYKILEQKLKSIDKQNNFQRVHMQKHLGHKRI